MFHGGYVVKSDPNEKLDRSYYPLDVFTTFYFDIDRDEMYFQKPGVDLKDSDNYWNLKNYIMVPTKNSLYLLGGQSRVEDIDLTFEKFIAMKYDYKFDGMMIKSIRQSDTFKPKKVKRTAIFEESSTVDHCYLAYMMTDNEDAEELENIYSICTFSDDNTRFKVMNYDVKTKKASFSDVTADFRPIPFQYAIKSPNKDITGLQEVYLQSGISEQLYKFKVPCD